MLLHNNATTADLQPNVADLPLSVLDTLPRWVRWQLQDKTDKKRNVVFGEDGKPKTVKMPWDATRHAWGSTIDPKTWGTREQAAKRVSRLPMPYGTDWCGVGVVLGDQGDERFLCGIDLDTCIDPKTGNVKPWAKETIQRFGTYTEESPSGTGYKLFFVLDAASVRKLFWDAKEKRLKGKEFKTDTEGHDHAPGIEVYVTDRYFTFTGDHLDATPQIVRAISTEAMAAFLRFAEKTFPGQSDATGSQSGRDKTDSGAGWNLACQRDREGKTLDEYKEEILQSNDPKIQAWVKKHGIDSREIERTWERAQESNRKSNGKITIKNAPNAADDLPDELTEDSVALAFTRRYINQLRYCHDAGGWYVWANATWRHDRTKRAFSWARELARVVGRDAGTNDRAKIGKVAFASAVERFAQADPALAVTSETWDRDPFLLGTPGGTVDLRTAELRPSQPSDLITKQTAVAPAATPDCPLWLEFLDQATNDDPGLIRFLRQWCGYCLTGDTREHALVFAYGTGGNGKGVFLNTVAGIMGDYAVNSAMDTFTASHGDKHSTDLAMLRGARMVTASETEEGKAWAEARIKALTGGDTITARFMRQDNFTFRPQFKLTIIGNHKPVLRNVDNAAKRRFNMIPFVHTPVRPDRELEAKLRNEWPEILRWMMEGCLDWQMNGLTRPQSVNDATGEYFEAQDYFGRWLKECCIVDPGLSTKPSVLFNHFQKWCEENGEPLTDNRKLRGMIERTPGLRYVTNSGIQLVRGIGFKAPPSPRRG